MADRLERPPLTLLSSIAHVVGKPNYESLTTEQRFSALTCALLVMHGDQLAEISRDLDAIRERGK